MRTAILTLATLLAAGPAPASHDWFGVDLCRSRPERMPPRLDPAGLPEPDSAGARLVARHCAQCHHLPGPGHHTAAEWARVAETMFLLGDVTARFGDRPDLLNPDEDERDVIGAYLQRHALRPLPAGLTAPTAYLAACGDCHAAPDPSLHGTSEWPMVMARMAGHRAMMAREPLDPLTATTALAFLSEHATTGRQDAGGRWVALAPVVLLAGFALRRLALAGRPS